MEAFWYKTEIKSFTEFTSCCFILTYILVCSTQHSVMNEEIPCRNDLQSIEYDTNGVAYQNGEVAHPNCDIDPEIETVEEGMLTYG